MAVYNTLVRETGAEVERLGMDENWIDVSARVVETRLRQDKGIDNIRAQQDVPLDNVVGLDGCPGRHRGCHCQERLYVGGVIAMELRAKVKEEHGLTVSAGISYNKLLAKLAGGLHKPNNQTVLGPGALDQVIREDMKVTAIPGIGRKMGETLESVNIVTVADLRAASIEDIVRVGLHQDNAKAIQDLSFGRDNCAVKMSGRVGSIGLEDRFMGIYDKDGVREKLVWLVDRLEQLIIEDGRQATTFKVTVRDYFKDKLVKKFHKESRQSPVSPRLFALDQGSLRSCSKLELVEIGVGLVGKMVNMSSQFHLTLLGVSVTDFVDPVESKASIKRFFSPVKNGSTGQTKRLSPPVTKSPTINKSKNDISTFFNNNSSSSGSQKRKLSFDGESEPSTSKLVREDLCCPKDYDQSVWESLPIEPQKEILSESVVKEAPAVTIEEGCGDKSKDDCPNGVDPAIFSQLPEDIRQELVNNAKKKSPPVKKGKKNDIKKYFTVQQAQR